jgi:Zn-dependent protease with chaperone function
MATSLDDTLPPDRTRVRLAGISSRAYEHPADRGALVALRKLGGFDVVLRRISGLFSERRLRLIHLASSVRAGDTQFRDLHHYVRDAAYILDLPDVPELYVVQEAQVGIMAIGTDRPFIVVTTGMVDLLDPHEQRFVIGHEVGHILSGHAVYRTMLLALTRLANRVAWIPLGYVGLRAIVTALEEWYRKSELSCDRAGLLACQDPDAAKRALMKTAGGSRLAEMNPDAFREQAREYETDGDARDGVIKLLSLMGRTHPFAVARFAELDRWITDGHYRRILDGDYPHRSADRTASISEEVRNAARSYQEAWSRTADPLFDVARTVVGAAAQAGKGFAGNVFNRPRG